MKVLTVAAERALFARDDKRRKEPAFEEHVGRVRRPGALRREEAVRIISASQTVGVGTGSAPDVRAT